MTLHREDLDAHVRAFKAATAASADGRATRARVLAGAAQRAHRRSVAARALPFALAGLVIGSSVSAGVTSLAHRWRAPAPIRIEAPPSPIFPARGRPGRLVVVPPEPAGQILDIAAAERGAYARAHEAHFTGTSPQRALAAWEDYLRAYPRGTFAPEARYNRALSLIRLGRTAAARDALRPFAAGAIGRGYRQADARVLTDWMDRRLR